MFMSGFYLTMEYILQQPSHNHPCISKPHITFGKKWSMNQMEYEPVFGSLTALKLSTLIPKRLSTEFPSSFSFPVTDKIGALAAVRIGYTKTSINVSNICRTQRSLIIKRGYLCSPSVHFFCCHR
jgi:hypothetical protein